MGASGVRIIFDNDQSVDVVVPDIFKNDVFGLCGNYDGIEDNDFVVEGKSFTEANEFGNFYHMNIDASSKCSNIPKRTSHPCAAISQEQLRPVEEHCKLLLGSKFSACHNIINPTVYYQRCISDVCMCGVDKFEECECEAFTHYSRQCAFKNVVLDWRSESLCGIECARGMVHSECSSACPKTCENKEI